MNVYELQMAKTYQKEKQDQAAQERSLRKAGKRTPTLLRFFVAAVNGAAGIAALSFSRL